MPTAVWVSKRCQTIAKAKQPQSRATAFLLGVPLLSPLASLFPGVPLGLPLAPLFISPAKNEFRASFCAFI